MYAMTPEDCMKCVDNDDCLPSCLLRGDCANTGVKIMRDYSGFAKDGNFPDEKK